MVCQHATHRLQESTHPHEPVTGLEALLALLVIVHQTETGGAAATELGLEAEDDDTLGVGLVDGSKLLTKLGTRDGRAGGVALKADRQSMLSRRAGTRTGW
jgi:hypothetical protein